MTFWSSTPPALLKPGGIAWWPEFFTHITDTLQQASTNVNMFYAQLIGIHDVLPKVTIAMPATQTTSGAMASTLQKLIASMVITQIQQGVITVAEAKVITAIAMGIMQGGAITDTLPKALTTINGIMLPQGAIADVLPLPATAMLGAEAPGGSIADVLPPVSTAIAGGQFQPGTVMDIIPQPTTALQVAQTQGGTIGSTLPLPTSALVVNQNQGGMVADQLAQVSSALNAIENPQGVIAASLQLASTAITGGQTQQATIASLLPKAITALTANQTQGGTIASALMQALTALVGQSVVSGVTPDAVGNGFVNESTTATMTFNSNASVGSTVLVFAGTGDSFGHQPVTGVTCGGVAMKLWTHVYPNNDSGKGDSYLYILQNIATANPSIVVTLAASSFAVAQSVSYLNVQNITLLSSAYSSTGSAPSVSASPALAGDVVVNGYQGQIGPGLTSSGGTTRYSANTTTASTQAGLIVQDTNAATTFNASFTGGFPTWDSITVNLSAVPSAVPLISGVNTSSTNTVPIPAHVPGNLIVIVAFNNGSNSPPGKPTASGPVPNWAYIDHLTGANSCSMTTASFVATASNHTSGTWTGMTNGVLVAIVLTGAGSTPIGGHAQSNYNVANKMTAPALTLTNTDGTSLILEIYAQVNPGSWNAAPAGYTRQAAYTNTGSTSMLCINTKNDSTSDGAIDQPDASGFGSAQPGCGTAIEIRKH